MHEKQSQDSPELGQELGMFEDQREEHRQRANSPGSTRRSSRRLPGSLCSEVTVGLMLGEHLKHLVISPTFIRGMSLLLHVYG